MEEQPPSWITQVISYQCPQCGDAVYFEGYKDDVLTEWPGNNATWDRGNASPCHNPVPYHPDERVWLAEKWRSWRWNDKIETKNFAQWEGDPRWPRNYIGYISGDDCERDSDAGPIHMDGKVRPAYSMPEKASRWSRIIVSVRAVDTRTMPNSLGTDEPWAWALEVIKSAGK